MDDCLHALLYELCYILTADDYKGSFNYDDTMTTNLYLGNINPKVGEGPETTPFVHAKKKSTTNLTPAFYFLQDCCKIHRMYINNSEILPHLSVHLISVSYSQCLKRNVSKMLIND